MKIRVATTTSQSLSLVEMSFLKTKSKVRMRVVKRIIHLNWNMELARMTAMKRIENTMKKIIWLLKVRKIILSQWQKPEREEHRHGWMKVHVKEVFLIKRKPDKLNYLCLLILALFAHFVHSDQTSSEDKRCPMLLVWTQCKQSKH